MYWIQQPFICVYWLRTTVWQIHYDVAKLKQWRPKRHSGRHLSQPSRSSLLSFLNSFFFPSQVWLWNSCWVFTSWEEEALGAQRMWNSRTICTSRSIHQSSLSPPFLSLILHRCNIGEANHVTHVYIPFLFSHFLLSASSSSSPSDSAWLAHTGAAKFQHVSSAFSAE